MSTSTTLLEAHPMPIDAAGEHAHTYAHVLIVCVVLTLPGATILQRIISDSVLSIDWLCVRRPHLVALHCMDPLNPVPISPFKPTRTCTLMYAAYSNLANHLWRRLP